MPRKYNVVDADGHILEPLDLWHRYIDPGFRDRAPKLITDKDGKQRLLIEDRIIGSSKGLGVAGAIGRIRSGGKSTNSPSAVAAFFVVHCGMFMGVHFLFLWVMFSGAWSRRIHGPADFVHQIIVDNRLWLPLAVLMLSRGLRHVDQHPADDLRVGTRRQHPLLCPPQLSCRDHFHGLGDLLRVLDRADPPA